MILKKIYMEVEPSCEPSLVMTVPRVVWVTVDKKQKNIMQHLPSSSVTLSWLILIQHDQKYKFDNDSYDWGT